MIGLEIRFLAGRFHGNAWHHAHNEGVPEWPPSPWRLLRALVSAAYSEHVPSTSVEPLIDKLSGLPRYRVPRAIDAHARYYMPDVADAGHKKSKVFDAFVAVDGGARSPEPLLVGWEANLSEHEHALLARLCRRVTYLGRAESWAELTPVRIEDVRWNCWPDEFDDHASSTTLLAVAPPEHIRDWARAQPSPKRGPDVPRTLWGVLTFDGGRYRDEGWSAVPGTRLVRYVFGEPPFRRAPVPAANLHKSRPTVARYAIRSPVLPHCHDALLVCAHLREAVMSQSKNVSGDPKPVFSGHGLGNGPSNHRHAFYLATTEQSRNRARFIDTLTIAGSAGFDADDVVALQRVRRLWAKNRPDLELILIGVGEAADFGGFTESTSAVLAESRIWQSVTPFVPTRHPKIVRGVEVDGIAEQIANAAEQVIGARPISVTPAGEEPEWRRFRRRRDKGFGRRGIDRPVGARLVFDRPVRGPLAIGFGAHFGLGLFTAVRESFQ